MLSILYNRGIPLTGVDTTYCGFRVELRRRLGQAHHRFWALWQTPAGGAGGTVFRERGGSTIEPKGIFIEVIVQMLMTHSSLKGPDQPSLQYRRRSVTQRQALSVENRCSRSKRFLGNPPYLGSLYIVVTPVKGIPLLYNML